MDFTWFDKRMVWFVAMLEIALTMLIAWMLAGLMLSLLPTVAVLPLQQDDQQVSNKNFPLQALIEAALFGSKPLQTKEIPKLAPPPKPAVKVVKQIKLNLQLKGVVYAGKNSVALIIAKPGAQQEVFRAGDEISTGVLLKRIAIDSIYVEIQGQEQQVWLEFATLSSSLPANVPNTVVQRVPPRMQQRGANRFGGARPLVRQGVPQRINRQVSRKMLDKELQDFSKLLMQARVLPHIQDGQPDGFMITDISVGSLYQKIGLLNGDIIKMVNGVPVRSMEQAMSLYQQLRNAAKIEMSVLRQGQLQHIQFDIQ